jgi:hypothetical protein
MTMTRDAPTASFGDGVALYPSYLGAFVTGRVSPRSAGKRSSFGLRRLPGRRSKIGAMCSVQTHRLDGSARARAGYPY